MDERDDDQCRCAHFRASHPENGPCQRRLPAMPEDELPEWRCPCRRFDKPAGGVWRWHAGTRSWQGVAAS